MQITMPGRPRKPISYGLTITARNRTCTSTISPRHIVESLGRNGDFFIFPSGKVKAVRLAAKREGIKVRINKHNAHKHRVERLRHMYKEEENEPSAALVLHYVTEGYGKDDQIQSLRSHSSRLAGFVSRSMPFLPEDLLDKAAVILADYEDFLSRN